MVEVRAPLIESGEDPAQWTSIADEDGMLDEERFDVHREALLGRLSPHVTPVQLGYADMLIENLAGYHLSTITQVTTRQLDELLLKTLPRNVSVPEGDAPEIIGALRALLEFAATHLGSAQAKTALTSLAPDLADRLAAALADKTKYGMAKSVIMAGMDAGYDLGTHDGLNAWLEVVNSGGFTLPRKSRAKKSATKSSAKPRKAKAGAKAAAKSSTKSPKAKSASAKSKSATPKKPAARTKPRR